MNKLIIICFALCLSSCKVTSPKHGVAIDDNFERAIANKQIDNLSDGQFQKVMIARALAQETPIILLDEPTAFLDVKNKKMIHSLLSELSIKKGKTIIVSTHNIEFCKNYCSKAWIIKDKKFLEKESNLISDLDFD